MVDLGQLLFTACRAVVSDRFEPGEVSEPATKPYATYEYDKDTSDENYLVGRTKLVNRIVQIDVYHTTYLLVRQTADEMVDAMLAQTHLGSPSSFTATQSHDMYVGRDPQTKTHRILLEFSVWFYR